MIPSEAMPWEWIPIAQIEVLNPRPRTKAKFREMVESVETVGLKKPILVAERRKPGGELYYVTGCGQGRLEAFKKLKQTEIPAIVIEASDKALLLTSLAENLARRHRSAVEHFWEIEYLRDRGYTIAQVAAKTGLGRRYVSGILRLLKQGETRLVQAVIRGQIPLVIAITIAMEDDPAVQKALGEAYDSGELRGDKLVRVRQIIDKRRARGKALWTGGRRKVDRELTSRDLVRVYEQEADRQREAIKKAELCEMQLIFVVSALKTLSADPEFRTLLHAEGLDDMPECLTRRLRGQAS